MNAMTMIAPHISRREFCCRHCGALPVSLVDVWHGEGWPTFFQSLFDYFKAIREEWGKAIPITSGYRCTKHPMYAVEKHFYDVHCFGLALDLGGGSEQEIRDIADCVERVAPKMRRGINLKNLHIHVDLGFLIYPKMTNAWVEEMRWTE